MNETVAAAALMQSGQRDRAIVHIPARERGTRRKNRRNKPRAYVPSHAVEIAGIARAKPSAENSLDPGNTEYSSVGNATLGDVQKREDCDGCRSTYPEPAKCHFDDCQQ